MKSRMRLLCLSLTMLCALAAAPFVAGQQIGDGIFQNTAIQPSMSDIRIGLPGRVWVEANFAEQGLGYEGSYLTVGGKTHLFQDFLDGRWLVEGQLHASAESGGIFGNVGVERVFTLDAAGADISLSAWADYDDDQQGDFAHSMTATGVSGSIKTHRWSLHGNGYFPVGTTDFAQGDPTGVNCFLNHSIVTQPGIDSALQGFDAIWLYKPQATAHLNGTVGVGGYGYSSDLVDFFGGVRARAGVQLLRGMIVNGEVNHDDRFGFSGVVQLAFLFGGRGRGTDYSLLGKDLDPTLRNDHIVRFQQDLVLAIDPDTGRPYNVYHVDNTADAAFANGTAETPFVALKDAEGASSTDDIIFVREGDGTTRNMDRGIVLKDGQLLLGDGVQHLIPLADGTNFLLCNDIDGNRPRITNRFFNIANGNAVTLADRNTVRGFIIDGSQGGMRNGIAGNEFVVGPSIIDGTIEDVTILGNPILNGVFLDRIAGDWTFARNNIQTAFADGIFISNALGTGSHFVFDSNIVSNNGRDGIHMEDYDGDDFDFINNVTNGNLRDGVRLERFSNAAGVGASFDFINPIARNNEEYGIRLIEADGDLRILNAQITNNVGGGIKLQDFKNTDPTHATLIGTSGGGTSNILGNGVGIGEGIFIELNAGTQRATITDSTITGNGIGIQTRTDGIVTTLTTDIVENLSVSNNSGDGMRFVALGGSTNTVLVENTGAPLTMNNNGTAFGNGISWLVGDASGSLSLLQGVVRNVNIGSPSSHGIFADIRNDGQLIAVHENINITTPGIDGLRIDADTDVNIVTGLPRAVSQVSFDNVTVTNVGDNGAEVNVGNGTFLDLAVTNSTFNNNGNNLFGWNFNVSGDNTDGGIVDTRFRLFAQNSSITNFDDEGWRWINDGDAHILAVIDAMTISGNGPQVNPPDDLPDGINLALNDDVVMNTRFTNNLITGNSGVGLLVGVNDGAELNMLMDGNIFSGNGAGNFSITNAPGGLVCLAMTTNIFSAAPILTNNSGGPSFILELDGFTNGPLTLIGAFDLRPFGTFCVPRIDAEETAFENAGFPPF